MLAAQTTREQRLAVADDVILNDGDIANLRDQVEKLHRQYLAAARTQSDRVAT
jgi:dephospho-CoA kinase